MAGTIIPVPPHRMAEYIKPGITYGQSDDYGYNLTDKDGNVIKPNKTQWTPGPAHIHDLNATILHLLGIDHTRLTYRYQGRDFRLTDAMACQYTFLPSFQMLFLFSGILAFFSCLLEADWRTWRGPGNDGLSDSTKLPDS